MWKTTRRLMGDRRVLAEADLCTFVRVSQGYRFFKSLQQTMLSRDLSEYAVTDVEARRLLLYMATSKAPDELYFPTLTQLDDRFASK